MTRTDLPRLLPPRSEDLRGHLTRFGSVPYRGAAGALMPDIEASDLTGRGGAAFPVHRKLAAVAGARGRKVAVANGAGDVYLYVHRGAGSSIRRALAERATRGMDRLAVTITQTPPRFLAGQERHW